MYLNKQNQRFHLKTYIAQTKTLNSSTATLTAVPINLSSKQVLPHGMEVKHRRLQFCKLDGSDPHRPDITLLVVAPLPLHSCHLRGHPVIHPQQKSPSKHWPN